MTAEPSDNPVRRHVEKHFSKDEVAGVLKLLAAYDGKEPFRVRLCILTLAEGRIDKIRHFLDVAEKDYRDILYWADPHNTLTKPE